MKHIENLTKLIGREMKYIMNNINQRMGVYILVSHLIITLAVILLYAITLMQGNESETMKTVMIVIVGYWFGSINKESLKSAEKISDTLDKNTPTPTNNTMTERENQNETIK